MLVFIKHIFKEGQTFSIDALRREIGIDKILSGKQLLAAHYYDKYFAKQGGWYARLFAELLSGPWIDEDSVITIHTDQLHDEVDSRRRDNIQEHFKDLPNFRLEWREPYQYQS